MTTPNYSNVFSQSFKSLNEHKFALAFIVIGMWGLIFGVTYLKQNFLWEDSTSYWAVSLVTYYVYTVMLVMIHRVVILGSDSVFSKAYRPIGKRELLYFFKTFIFIIPVWVLFLILKLSVMSIIEGPQEMGSADSDEEAMANLFVGATAMYMYIGFAIVAFFSVLAFLFIFIPWFLLSFPATAVDVKMSFREAMTITKEHASFCYIHFLLYPFLLILLYALLSFIFPTWFLQLFGLISLLWLTLILSLVYKDVARIENEVSIE